MKLAVTALIKSLVVSKFNEPEKCGRMKKLVSKMLCLYLLVCDRRLACNPL